MSMDTVLYGYNLGVACFELYYVADDDEKDIPFSVSSIN